MPSFKPIHTKYHKLDGSRYVLSVGGKAATRENFQKWIDKDKLNGIIEAVGTLPRYVIYSDLIDMLMDRDGSMQKSLKTMIEHDLGHLPFPRVLVEFDDPAIISDGNGTRNMIARHFVYLEEEGKGLERFTALSFTLIEDNIKGNVIAINPIAASAALVTEDQADKLSKERGFSVTGEGSGVIFTASPCPYFKSELLPAKQLHEIVDQSIESAMAPASRALCALIVLLATKGVEREVITVDKKLNKIREASGKQRISDHTVIRIGHVYSRSGEQVKYVGGSSGRVMPVHWRSGHVRHQRYGVGLKQTHDVWIAPMLINYVEGDNIPVPKTKEVTI